MQLPDNKTCSCCSIVEDYVQSCVHCYLVKGLYLHMDGSTYQGHRRFSSKSRGKQCAFMSLSALLTVPRAQGTGEIRNTVNGLMPHFILR